MRAVNFPKKSPLNPPFVKGGDSYIGDREKAFRRNVKTELYFPQSCFVASRAPSAIDRNFAQAICG
jgi:hypothetical protein